MATDTTTVEYTIDAKGKALGRVASQAAVYLMGKNNPHVRINEVAPVKVTVENASQMTLARDEKKLKQKQYITYSGYPGGQKVARAEEVIDKKGYEAVVRNAVYGMLPGNKLRKRRMMNLIVEE